MKVTITNNAMIKFLVCRLDGELLAHGALDYREALEKARMHATEIGTAVRLWLDDGCPAMLVPPIFVV